MSSQRAALIAGILAAPDDDVPRLVCADWFEEQGDEASVARAEFIRVQIERARLPVEDVRHSELQARELRLLKRYGRMWCGSHFVFKKARFRRGFIEGVHLHLTHFLHHRRQMLELEPVRDLRLTGWFRAPADLLRRVAGCEELRHVETLRIHHQGPHKDPRGDLLILLESPHWRRLRALHGTQVAFDADARRRFDRLPVLRQVTELTFPTLYPFPTNPGEWFYEGADFAQQWGELRSLTFPALPQLSLLRWLSAMPWWERLTRLALTVPVPEPESLALLRDRLPRSLRELRLGAGSVPADLRGLEAFLEQLGSAPLRALHLYLIPVRETTLDRLLDGANRWELQELTLSGCQLSAPHARAIARAAGAARLHSLELSDNEHFGPEAARALFGSKSLRSVIHLGLLYTRLGSEGAAVLASADGWERLRSLDISPAGLRAAGLKALLASLNLRNLNWLNVNAGMYGDEPDLRVSPALARAITALPNLVHLRLDAQLGPESRDILSNSNTLAWPPLFASGSDVHSWRALRAPENTPPLDTAIDGDWHGR
jgi:uncharacterized protein (TIGR02996 family)